MAYDGWLIRINKTATSEGAYKIPLKYIKAESYSPYVNMQDVDAYTDANGYLHRDAVSLKVVKVEFETPAMLTNKTFSILMNNIKSRYSIAKARQLCIQAYIPEYNDYSEWQTGYLADFQPQIYHATTGTKKQNGDWKEEPVIQYNSIRLAFIGGVYSG